MPSPAHYTKFLTVSRLSHCLFSLWTQSQVLEELEAEVHVMATGELNPNHYPAQRAAKVVQHYLNTRYGSPYRLFGLHRVHSGNAQVCQLVTQLKLFQLTKKVDKL